MGATGLYIAGRKNWAGWAIGLGAQVLWVVYTLTTRQWGFLVSAALYGGVYVHNILRWRGVKGEIPGRADAQTGTQTGTQADKV